uniref:NADH-ubiquinone oxidoreductase chain 6 n=1 Tax=Nesidiocoris poppiusi TaxID=3059073 RepID=A0AAT9VVG2_9HEMI|nr:NADH dehydrogenase subunit 6 [Nesidiocoris poppiusi]WKW91657.1 NADH dehydrogenase subunit 6 [Nesidiocoris poppiusi]
MISMIFMMNILFLIMKHPMSMGLILIMQTLMIALHVGCMMKTFWVAYIMVIIILSGMLVLFIYMASVASNEKFSNNSKLMITSSMLFMFLVIMEYVLDTQIMMKKNSGSTFMMYYKTSDIQFLQKMFTSEYMYITIMMMLYLFFTMIMVNYMVNKHEGTMKTKTL